MGTTGVLHELRNKIIGFLFTIRSIYNHTLYCWKGLFILMKSYTIALFFDISKNCVSQFLVVLRLFAAGSYPSHLCLVWEGYKGGRTTFLASGYSPDLASFDSNRKFHIGHLLYPQSIQIQQFTHILYHLRSTFVPCLGRLQGWAGYLSGRWVLARPGLI